MKKQTKLGKKMQNKPLLIKLVMSFTAILVLPVLILYPILELSVFAGLEKEVVTTNISKLNAVKNNVENMLDSIDMTVLSISLHDELNELGAIDEIKGGDIRHILLIEKVMNYLISAVKTNENISSVMLYAPNSEYVITSNKEVRKSESFEYGEWIEIFKETKDTSIVTMEGQENLFYNNIVTFIYPVSEYVSSFDGAIAVNVSKEHIGRMLNNTNNTEGTVVVFDEELNTMLTHNSSRIDELDKSSLAEEIHNKEDDEGYVYTNLDNGKNVAVYVKGGINNRIYAEIQPASAFMSAVRTLRIVIITAIIILLLFGVVLSVMMSERIYSPIKSLMNRVRLAGSYSKANNEIDAISDAVEGMIKSNKDMSEFVENNRLYLRNMNIELLLSGITENSQSYDRMGIKLLENHCCAMLSIDRFEQFSEQYDTGQAHHMKQLICDICEKSFDESIKCYAVPGRNESVYLLLSLEDNNDADVLVSIEESLMLCKEKVKELTKFSVTITLGGFVKKLCDIKKSHQESIDAIKYRMLAGYDSIIPNWQYDIENEAKYYYPENEEKHLLNMLLANDKDGISDALAAFFDSFIHQSDLGYMNLTYIYTRLLGAAIKFLNDNKISNTYILSEYSMQIHNELKTNTLEEINLKIKELFLEINSLNGVEEKYLARVIDYIESNFRIDFDMETLAQSVGISYAHLRRIFKNYIGTNLTSYINKRRIEEAKKLLSETDMTVMDMAVSLGYNNDQSFTRFFKKYEGITPGAYRNAVKAQNNN